MLSARTRNAAVGAIAVLALAVAIDLFGIGELPFYTNGEPREAIVVWEMANGGGLVLPLRNGTEIPSKPPLFHWLGLIASKALGELSELSVRLPSALLAIVVTLAVYAFGASAGRLRSGWLAATALLLSFEWMRAARTSRVDMTLTFFMTIALLCFGVIERSGVTRARLVVFYACLAMAGLAKGPVGVALPCLVIFVYAAIKPLDPVSSTQESWSSRIARRARTVRDLAAPLRPLRGLAAVVIVASLWYAAAAWIGGREFLETHVLRENLLRVTDADAMDSGHKHGPLYLFGQFFLGAFPWSLVAPAVAWWLWRDRPLDPTRRYLVVWFVVIFVFFLIPESKRGVYLLPAYPAAALLLGLVLGPGPEGESTRRLAGYGLIASCLVIAILGVGGLIVASGIPFEGLVAPRLKPPDRDATLQVIEALRANRWWTLAASVLTLAGAAAAAHEARGAHWLRGSVPLVVALLAALGGLVGPAERAIAEGRTFRDFAKDVRAELGDGPLAFAPRAFDYGVLFYAQRRIPALPEKRTEPMPSVIAQEQGLKDLGDGFDVVLRSSGTGPKGRSRLVLAAPRTP